MMPHRNDLTSRIVCHVTSLALVVTLAGAQTAPSAPSIASQPASGSATSPAGQTQPTKEQQDALNKQMEIVRAAEAKVAKAPEAPRAAVAGGSAQAMAAGKPGAGAAAPTAHVSKRAVLQLVTGTLNPYIQGVKKLNDAAASALELAATLTLFDPAGKSAKQQRAREIRQYNTDWDQTYNKILTTVNGFVVGTRMTYEFPLNDKSTYTVNGIIDP